MKHLPNMLFIFILSAFIGAAFSTCGEKKDDKSRAAPATTTTPTPTYTPTETPTPTSTVASLENCLSQGLAWVPDTTKFGAKHCAGKLVTDWCCNQNTIESRFDKEHDLIAAKFQSSTYTQLKLYACSIEPGNSPVNSAIPIYNIHFAATIGNVVYYQVMQLTELSNELTNVTGKDLTPTCQNPLYSTENALLGTPTSTSTITGTSTITSTATMTNTDIL